MYLKSQTILLVHCISGFERWLKLKKTALPLLSVFKETTAHTPANTACASHCPLPRNQVATVFYKMFFVLIMHRFPVLSINKTEMSWTSLRGITIRRGKFASKPLLRNTQEKWHLCVKIQYNVFINIYLWDDGTFILKPRLPFLTVSRLTFVFESQTIRVVQLRFPRFKPSGEEKKGITAKL